MKSCATILLALILTGCQSGLPVLSEKKISALSNEDLCVALGSYNSDGSLVLKIYDELNRRPQKIDSERCYVLEKIGYMQQHPGTPPAGPGRTDALATPAMQAGLPASTMPSETIKLIQRERAKYRIKPGG